MPVIDPQGLFEGERLSACSDQAKFFWPYIYCASNGFARLEINLRQLRLKCFACFITPPTDTEILGALKEYADNYLLTIYEHEGRQWAQFDTHQKYLPKHKSKKDLLSPAPPDEALSAFAEGYIQWKKAKSLCLHHSRKISETFENLRKISNGIGTGIGIGEGIGVGEGNAEPATLSETEDTDMKIKNEIAPVCYDILGIPPESYADVWTRMNVRAKATSCGQVVNEFRAWAQENVGETFSGRPITAFLRYVERTPEVIRRSDPVLIRLVRELAYCSQGEVTFDDRAKVHLAKALADDNSVEDIVRVFKADFLPTLNRDDKKQMQFAGWNFVQKVDQLVYTLRRKRQEREQEAQAVAATAERMRRDTEADLARLRAANEQESASVEETLGGGE